MKPYVTWIFAYRCGEHWGCHSLNDDENTEAHAIAAHAGYVARCQPVGPIVRVELPRPTAKTKKKSTTKSKAAAKKKPKAARAA